MEGVLKEEEAWLPLERAAMFVCRSNKRGDKTIQKAVFGQNSFQWIQEKKGPSFIHTPGYVTRITIIIPCQGFFINKNSNNIF